MLPLLRMSLCYLWLYQPPELTVDCPSYPIALTLPHLEDNLDTFRIECVDIDPYTLIKKHVKYLY